jgi:hypothetical protein
MGRLVAALDAHSGSITALATILLAVLTAVYVYLTKSIASAVREQSRLLTNEHEARREMLILSIYSVRDRIRESLERLPGERSEATQLRLVRLWTHDDLRDLEHACRSIHTGPAVTATMLVSNLRALESWIKEVQGTPDYDWEKFPWSEYQNHRSQALGLLEGILEMRLPAGGVPSGHDALNFAPGGQRMAHNDESHHLPIPR